MKHIIFSMLLLLLCSNASAISIQWLPLGATTNEGNPTTLLGNPILEFNNAGEGGNDWVATGIGPRGGWGSRELWLLDDSAGGILGTSEATTTFSIATNSVGFIINGDHNDGLAQFFVDNIDVGTYDLYQTGLRSLVVTGLNSTAHTLNIVQLGLHNSSSIKGDVAILGGAAFNTPAIISEPGILSLIIFPLLYFFIFTDCRIIHVHEQNKRQSLHCA